MADLLFVAVVVVFFTLAALLVRACEHIIGPDELRAPELDHDDLVHREAEVAVATGDGPVAS